MKRAVIVGVAVCAALIVGVAIHDKEGFFGAAVAAWVQAIGSIGAIGGAAWIASQQAKWARHQRLSELNELRLGGKTLVLGAIATIDLQVKAMTGEIAPERIQSTKILERRLAGFPVHELRSGELVRIFFQVEYGIDNARSHFEALAEHRESLQDAAQAHAQIRTVLFELLKEWNDEHHG